MEVNTNPSMGPQGPPAAQAHAPTYPSPIWPNDQANSNQQPYAPPAGGYYGHDDQKYPAQPMQVDAPRYYTVVPKSSNWRGCSGKTKLIIIAVLILLVLAIAGALIGVYVARAVNRRNCYNNNNNRYHDCW